MKRDGLREARKELGLNQIEFAKVLELHVDTVRSLEYGRVNPSATVLLKICKLTGKEPQLLFPDII
ncbi:helix-turn-helix transcriptional regulator [Paenibacillus daejeonensis]|uniref:helix-turn-helix transcriptional regulator n=1 Tax=Paenibacillus daejeonensis TaxID=135193 RepID=UPI0003672821|nr:helix-turn-helix transcriptional regulator [Paenibacillus daejeonensis]